MMALLSKLLTGGLIDQLSRANTARHRAETEQERIEAEVQIARIQATQNRGSLMDLLAFIAGLPVALLLGCVALVSAFPGAFPDWTVLALPAPMNEWQGRIILGLFGLSAVGRLRR
ncbi:MAG: hypothetical protein JXR13_19880 [Thalassovita sp.]